MKTLSQRLVHAMTTRNMTQGALAKASGVSQPTIWRLASGGAEGSKKLVDIANALRVDVDWLANGVGEMNINNLPPKIEQEDISKIVPIWDENGKTGSYALVPIGKSKAHWKAVLLPVSSGCDVAPAGSIVIYDNKIYPGTGDFVVAKINGKLSVYKFLTGGSSGMLAVDDTRVPLIDLSSPSAELAGTAVFLMRDLRR